MILRRLGNRADEGGVGRVQSALVWIVGQMCGIREGFRRKRRYMSEKCTHETLRVTAPVSYSTFVPGLRWLIADYEDDHLSSLLVRRLFGKQLQLARIFTLEYCSLAVQFPHLYITNQNVRNGLKGVGDSHR
jgi:hypothetical protein